MSFDTFPSSGAFPLSPSPSLGIAARLIYELERQRGRNGAWSADSRFVVGLYGAIPGARARGRLHAAVRVRDNGMGCQISKLPELVGLLLPVGLLTEAIVMTTVIYLRIRKSGTWLALHALLNIEISHA